jgi:glucosamine-6-phosphate deaminase
MKLEVTADDLEMNRKAADVIIAEWRRKPDLVLGLATGGTMIGLYKHLAARYQKEQLDFSQVTTFNLDEYYPIPPEHPQSYHFFMQDHFFRFVNIPPKQIHLLNGQAEHIEKECEQYEQLIQSKGGIDLQILGIGGNGHIGFNEPGTPFTSCTHKISLAKGTIQANARFFEHASQVPQHALTMGINTIMSCKKILLLASGKQKAAAISAAFLGPIREEVPASVLQLHPDVTVLMDQQAAANLTVTI